MHTVVYLFFLFKHLANMENNNSTIRYYILKQEPECIFCRMSESSKGCKNLDLQYKLRWSVHLLTASQSDLFVLQYFSQNSTAHSHKHSVLLLLIVPMTLSGGRPCHQEWCPHHLDEGRLLPTCPLFRSKSHQHNALAQLSVLMKL